MLESVMSWLGYEAAEQLPVPAPDKPADSLRSSRWPKVRAEHLKREPACRACGARSKLEVHHKLPFHRSTVTPCWSWSRRTSSRSARRRPTTVI